MRRFVIARTRAVASLVALVSLIGSAPVQAAPECVFQGQTRVRIGDGSSSGGSVGGGAATLGRKVFMGEGTTVFGQQVKVGNGSALCFVDSETPPHLGGNVSFICTETDARGAARAAAACEVPQTECGGSNVSVGKGGSVTVPAGSHGTLVAEAGAAVTLAAGTHTFCSIATGRNVAITVAGPGQSTIDVAGDLSLGNGSSLQPAAGAATPIVRVAGDVVVGSGADVQAFIAARGRVLVGRGASVTGSACGDAVLTARHATLACATDTPNTTSTTTSTTTTSSTTTTTTTTTTRPTTSTTSTTTSTTAPTTSTTSTSTTPPSTTTTTTTSTTTTAAPTTTTTTTSTTTTSTTTTTTAAPTTTTTTTTTAAPTTSTTTTTAASTTTTTEGPLPTTTSTTAAPTTTTTTTTAAPTTTSTTTTTTTTTSTTTTTTLAPRFLDFVSAKAVDQQGNLMVCGDVLNSSGQLINYTLGATDPAPYTGKKTVHCGALALGNGGATVLENVTPDGGANRFTLNGCVGGVCNVGPYATYPAALSTDYDCSAKPAVVSGVTKTCNFGTPLPIPNQGTSSCVVNTFRDDPSGQINLNDGTTSTLSIKLASRTYLTGKADGDGPCPICKPATGAWGAGANPTPSISAPQNGTCSWGARNGQTCKTTNSKGLSRDCLPQPGVPAPGVGSNVSDLGALDVDLAPLTTVAPTPGGSPAGTPIYPVVKNADTLGKFCTGQNSAGCFGQSSCRTIRMGGSPAGALLPAGTSKIGNMSAIFCVPSSSSALVNFAAGLPGPGATSIYGTFTAVN